MDNVDRGIIEILRRDGRASNARIARDLDVSEGTIRRRLGRLISDNVIDIRAIPNLGKMGFSIDALVGLQTTPGQLDEIANTLASMEESSYVAVSTGPFDLFVIVGLPSKEELSIFLKEKVGGIPGVIKTETFLNLEIKKGS